MATKTSQKFPNHAKLTSIELTIRGLGKVHEEQPGVRSQPRIKTLTFTGSEVLFSYQLQPSSRIFQLDSPDKFLAVDFSQLRFEEERPSDYIKRILGVGIVINKKRYHYLGQSNSQIKDRKCILMEADPKQIAVKLNGLVRDLTSFKSTAKLAKRIGLLFSAGQNVLQLKEGNYTMIDDIERDGHCFTDGCGHVSQKFVTLLASKSKLDLTFRNARHYPSVIQIRYQGFKGILLVGKHLQQGKSCEFRKSMLKFSYKGPCDFCVVDYSKPYTFGRLNAQIIILLSALEVPDEVFIRKQCQHYDRLEAMFTDMPTAFEYLLTNGEVSLAGDLFENGFTKKIDQYLQKSYRHELDTSLKEKRNASGHEQVEKLRIIVEDSRLAFAAADPTGILVENQCFFRPTIANKPRTITGKIFCVRNPCYHAGDIVVLDAVHLHDCEHIVDVLLFSVNGTCPTAHRSSGGDLDGDRFFVCWDEDLMPRVTVESYGYPASAEKESSKKITAENRIEHFACYSNAGVSRCAELFQKWADAKGPRCEECIQINALFSHAVDGQVVQIPDTLLQPPAIDEPSRQGKIWNKLVTLAQEYRSKRSRCKKVPPMPCAMDEDGLQVFLENYSQEATDYEIFSFLGWCHANDDDVNNYIHYVNFETFTDIEKSAVLATGKVDRDYLYNALHMSEILTDEHLNFFAKQYRQNWKLFHRRDGCEVSASLVADLLRAVSDFRRVFIVLEFSHEISICIFLNGTFKPDIHNDACEKIEVYAFQRNGLFRLKKLCTNDFMLRFNEKRFAIFLAHPGTTEYKYTFIWLGIPEKLNSRITALNDLKLETKISIALEKLMSNTLRGRTPPINKLTIIRSEIYVLANRDNVCTKYEVVNPEYAVEMHMADVDSSYKPASPANPESDSDRQLLSLSYTNDLNVNQLIERLVCWLKYGLFEKSIDACQQYLQRNPAFSDIEKLVNFAIPNPVIHYPLSVFGAYSSDVTPEMTVNLIASCAKASKSKRDTLGTEAVGNLLACAKPLNVPQISQIVTSLVADYPYANTVLAYIDGFMSLIEENKPPSENCTVRTYFIRQLKLLAMETLEEFSNRRDFQRNGYRAYEHRSRNESEGNGNRQIHFKLLSVGSLSVRTRPGDIVFLKRLNRTSKEFIPCLRATVLNSFPELVVDVSWIPRDFLTATWAMRVTGNIIGFRNSVTAIKNLYQKADTSLVRFLADPEEPIVLEMDGSVQPCDDGTDLNPSQRKAIEVAEQRILTLWQGPAGTGKTSTIYKFILRLCEKQDDLPILVTAATNVAVDNIALLLRQHNDINVIRIGDMKSIDSRLHDITIEVQPDGSFRRANYKKAKDMIHNAKIICATCVGCGNSHLDKLKFCFVITDEASLVAEPICLIPLAKNCQQFLLVGDHKQLRPFCMPMSEENGYSVSLFERIFEESRVCLLNTQYRMHPGIAEFPNRYFYNGKLLDGVDGAQRPSIEGFSWPNKNIPVAFVQVKGDDGTVGGSKFNESEVEVLVQTLKHILEANGIKPGDIGIISLYVAQLEKLKCALSSCRSANTPQNVEVNTADGFQGREKDLIMITCVRCNENGNIGFLADPRRFNVMLTRAKRGLIIFGDEQTLSSNTMWKDWFTFSRQRKLLLAPKKRS